MKTEENEIQVCDYCFNEVQLVGEDGISVCDEGGCGIVEGNTHYITESKFEEIHS
jgi:hypothetical protein